LAGLNHLATASSPDEFWSIVKQQLQVLPTADERQITKILLASESATNSRFLRTLRDALYEVTVPPGNEMLLYKKGSELGNLTLDDDFAARTTNPLFAAARGAALYARWRQEAPYECIENKHCAEKRRKERKELVNAKLELR
jgi:hypothetical protein